MSERALPYYEDHALFLGVPLPEVLRGQAVPLLAPEDGRLSLHNLRGPVMEQVAKRCGSVLGSAGLFAAGAIEAGPVACPAEAVRAVVETGLRPCLPKGRSLPTGHFEQIAIEAISSAEVPDDAFASYTPARRRDAERLLNDPACDLHQVYLLSSGLVKSGGRTLATAGFTLVLAAPGAPETARYFTAPLSGNALQAARLLREARGIASAVEWNKRQTPVNLGARSRQRDFITNGFRDH